MRNEKLKAKSCEKGITLIALVITIVVMLILAGVTINLTLGENGIFTTAQQAAKNYTEAQEKEQAELNNFESTLNNMLSGGEELLNGAWSAKNKVNKPNLAGSGLTPVTINSNGTYGVPDIAEDSWYTYDGTTNKWANARTKDGSMWVWIPRYAYKITYTDAADKSKGGTIDVVFLQGTTNTDYNGNDVTQETYVDEKGVIGAYIVHPAFKDGTATGFTNGEWDKEISGFWMAKFEAGYAGEVGKPETATDSDVEYSTIYSYDAITHDDYGYNYYGERKVGTKIKYPTFQANRASVNFIGIADAYDLCRSIQNATEVYGLKNTDSHMTKNSEWGAVAYLSHSKYGRNGEEVVLNNISINNTTESVYAVTGYAATSTSSGTATTTWDKIQKGEQAGSWLTSQGQTASTTKNIYGIYDLSGGAWEWTSAYIATEGNYETYGGNLKGDSSKYKTKYAHSGTGAIDTDNYDANSNIIGNAVAETSASGNSSSGAWNGYYSGFPGSSEPFFVRGGSWVGGSYAGTFAFARTLGYCSCDIGFRAVLVVE